MRMSYAVVEKKNSEKKTCALTFTCISDGILTYSSVIHIKNKGGLYHLLLTPDLVEIPVSIFFYGTFSQDLKCLPIIIYNMSHVSRTEICAFISQVREPTSCLFC